LKGIAAVGAYTLVISLVFWYAIKMTIGLRVTKEEEEEGLDIGEHGQVAYVGFSNTAFPS
jgi:Amt family ammonium transporter